MTEKSISDILADLGVTHERDSNSINTQTHRLYYADRFIGDYDAHQVGDLIREHLLTAAQTMARGLSRGPANNR